MSDDSTQNAVKVPPEVEREFPDIIELIRSSESMNDEERQYWVDILLVMTPEQVQQLRDILQNEREQLAAIDAKYATEIQKMGDPAALQKMSEDRRSKKMALAAKEASEREKSQDKAEDILENME